MTAQGWFQMVKAQTTTQRIIFMKLGSIFSIDMVNSGVKFRHSLLTQSVSVAGMSIVEGKWVMIGVVL